MFIQKMITACGMILILTLLLAGCRAGTVEDALHEKKYANVKIAQEIPLRGGAAVLFRAQVPGQPNLYPLHYAFLEGSAEKGWKVLSSGYDYYGNNQLTVTFQRIPDSLSGQEASEASRYLVYGEMNNPYIAKVMLKDDDGAWHQAELQKERDFLFYRVGGGFRGVKAYAENGALVDIQGTGDDEMTQFMKRSEASEAYLKKVLGGMDLRGFTFKGEDEPYKLDGSTWTETRKNVWRLSGVNPITYGDREITVRRYEVELGKGDWPEGAALTAVILMGGRVAAGGYVQAEMPGEAVRYYAFDGYPLPE